MRKTFGTWLVLFLGICMVTLLAGCSSMENTAVEGPTAPAPNEQAQNLPQQDVAGGLGNGVDGLPQGFPAEIPFFAGAQVMDADTFNGNNYTVLYTVTAGYSEVVDFYTQAFTLDGSGTGEGEAYYEGIDFGEIFIKGLTVEETGDAVNVYMTLEDNGQDMNLEGYAGSEEMTDAAAAETAGSAIMTYDTAEEVTLDSSYPQDVVPLPSGAKVIGCSMVPGKASGFVDLVLPADSFDSTVTFYTDTLGLTPKTSTTAVQAAASFQGEIAGIKVSVLVSNLLGGGHDTLVQITVDEK